MSDDIVESLRDLAFQSTRFTTIDLLQKAAAEIVRLRGEVSRWKTLAEDAQVMYETAIEVDAQVADIDAIVAALQHRGD